MPDIHIDRLEVTVSGIDPGTVERAVRPLLRLVASKWNDPVTATAQDGVVRLDRSPPADGLAEQIANHVVGVIRARAANQSEGM